MISRNKRFGIAVTVIVLILIGVGAVAAYVLQRSFRGGSARAADPKAILTVTYSGGMCPRGKCGHPVYNLYSDGRFDGHTKLSSAEVQELQKIIDNTDFLAYAPQASPFCSSFVDGFDQVLIFPRKYGNKSFVPCMIEGSGINGAFTKINRIISAHTIQEN